MDQDLTNLNETQLIKEINKIKVFKPLSREAIVDNPTDLPVLVIEKNRVIIGIDQLHCAVFSTEEKNAERLKNDFDVDLKKIFYI